MPDHSDVKPDRRGALVREGLLTLCPALVVTLFALGLLLRDPYAFWRDDYQTYHLAGFCDMAHAWRAGEFPLLSPHAWMCGALAAEYQCGVFSVFLHPLVIVAFELGLSLPTTAAVLSIVHLAVLAAGAFRLARFRGLGPSAAMFVALVAALNGYTFVWGARIWFSALASFAWMPWFWWGLERGVARESGLTRFLPAGIFLYLVITAGWPFTVLMAGLLSAWFIMKVWWEHGGLRPAWPVAASWALGLALSAPAWMMLVEYGPHTLRDQMPADSVYQLRVPLSALFGLVFPAWVSGWNVFGQEIPHQNLELIGGLVPLVLVYAAWRRAGRAFLDRCKPELLLTGVTLALAVLPGFGPFRWTFRWLPLFFLALGFVGGCALAALREEVPDGEAAEAPRKPVLNLGILCACLVASFGCLAWRIGAEPAEYILMMTFGLTAVALAWAWAESRAPSLLRPWVPCLVVLATCGLSYWDVRRFIIVAEWPFDESIREPAPLDPERRYFTVAGQPDILEVGAAAVTNWNWGKAVGLRPGNAWMYAGVTTVNGYSPMIPSHLDSVFRFVSHAQRRPEDAERVLRHWSAPGGFLDFLGVNGLVVADAFLSQTRELEQHEWWYVNKPVDGGKVYHRGEAQAARWRSPEQVLEVEHASIVHRRLHEESGPHRPMMVSRFESESNARPLSFAPAQVELIRDGRNAVAVQVVNPSAEREALLVFLRPWFPGYRAQLDGQELPVQVVDGVLPAVRLPAGAQGQLLLEYRPVSLVVGCWLAGVAVVGSMIFMAYAGFRARWRRTP